MRSLFNLFAKAPGLIVPQLSPCRSKATKRLYSVIHDQSREEKVSVWTGNDDLVLHISTPPTTLALTPVIMHIPPICPTPSKRSPPASTPAPLTSHFTTVRFSPSWSAPHRFPAPLHAVLAAHDWILANILRPAANSSSSSDPTAPTRKLAIYGQQLGGTLATSLALTEPRIAALAAADAVYDFTGLATAAELAPTADESMRQLFAWREHLFRAPAAAFDAFASPMLFFRTPGLSIPAAFPVPASAETEAAAEVVASRRSHLVFPPRDSGRVLPFARLGVSVPKGSVLDGQARDMEVLMRRSVSLHEVKEGRGREDVDYVGEAEDRVKYVRMGEEEEEGLWVAEFFRDVLGDGSS